MQQPQRRQRAFGDLLPRSPEDLPRVYAWFEQMRSNQPVFRAEQMPIWQVFRYEDVQEVITDHHRFSSEATFGDSFLANTLVTTDPPDHRTLRNLVNQAFTPRAVTRLSHRVTQITQELLDAGKATGHMDFVSDIAFPLPAKIIAEMLGVPAEDWDIFQRWARFGGGRENEGSRERAGGSAPDMRQEMNHYFLRLLEARRKDPRDDLITSLSNAEIDGEHLSQQELVNFCFLLLAAGSIQHSARAESPSCLWSRHPLLCRRSPGPPRSEDCPAHDARAIERPEARRRRTGWYPYRYCLRYREFAHNLPACVTHPRARGLSSFTA